MDVKHRHHNEVLIIDIPERKEGNLCEDIDSLIAGLFEIIDKSMTKVALDISKKEYLNSNGLSELIKIKDLLLDKGIELFLIGVSKRVMSILELVGVENFFNIVNNEDEL